MQTTSRIYVVHRENTKKYKNIGIDNYELVAILHSVKYVVVVVFHGVVNSAKTKKRSRNEIPFCLYIFSFSAFLPLGVARLPRVSGEWETRAKNITKRR